MIILKYYFTETIRMHETWLNFLRLKVNITLGTQTNDRNNETVYFNKLIESNEQEKERIMVRYPIQLH